MILQVVPSEDSAGAFQGSLKALQGILMEPYEAALMVGALIKHPLL